MTRLQGFAATATFITSAALAQTPPHEGAPAAAAAAENVSLSRAERGDLMACLSHFRGPLASNVNQSIRNKLGTQMVVSKNFDDSLWLVDRSESDAGLIRLMNVAGEAVALDLLPLPAPNPTKATLVHFAWDGKKRHAKWQLEASGHKNFEFSGPGFDALEEWKMIRNSNEREAKAINWKPNFDAITDAYVAYLSEFIDPVAKNFPRLGEERADATPEEKSQREALLAMVDDCSAVPRFAPALEKVRAQFKLPTPSAEEDSATQE
ncbi:MAG TPA: hypothetical protein VM901_07480 [Bdellovibrionota bacterium]|jgi:hypothetical protein|nr:hypothetical protein [Bdellovibrionota bacterium]